MATPKKVASPADVPNATHYLLIVFGENRVYVPGDERSRTNPGHGYPEHTDVTPTRDLYVHHDKASLQAHLTQLYKQDPNRTDIVVLEVERKLEVSTQVVIRI